MQQSKKKKTLCNGDAAKQKEGNAFAMAMQQSKKKKILCLTSFAGVAGSDEQAVLPEEHLGQHL